MKYTVWRGNNFNVDVPRLGLRNANHIGRVGTYSEMATRAGLVALHFVNVYNTLVAPHGGGDRCVPAWQYY